MSEPNARLIRWQDAAGLSNRALAVLVADAAAGMGIMLRTTATQVAAWRAGQQPRARAAAVIAQVLSAACGLKITPFELGFTATGASGSPIPAGHQDNAVAALASAGRAAAERLSRDRRSLIKSGIGSGLFVSAALEWLLLDPSGGARADKTGTPHVTDVDADRLWSRARALLAIDNRFGGRFVRPQALALLNDSAIPVLAGRRGGETGARKLATAVAYTGHLAGWTCIDSGDFASAQTLLTASLGLAKTAEDAIVAAGILTDMAFLEHLAGRARDGVLLAQVAQRPGPGRLPAAILARAAAIQARCHATLADVPAALAAAGRAESYLRTNRADTDPHPLDFFFTIGQLHAELHVAYRDLVVAGQAKPSALFEHARLIDAAPHMGRRAALLAAEAAVAHLIDGDLDAATRQADAAIAAAALLNGGSGRVLSALARIRPHLIPFTRTTATARDLDARLRAASPRTLTV